MPLNNIIEDDKWDKYEIPGTFYMALARRGQEAISSEQCFLDGCDNDNIDYLEPFEKESIISEKKPNGTYYKCDKIRVKCKKCNGIFQFALKTTYAPSKDENNKEIIREYMAIAYILDEKGKNLGEIGYF
ncbi:MAG: hypothetical protein GY870_20490 [archaeon]|nr:hypothetical protein [archaeon]